MKGLNRLSSHDQGQFAVLWVDEQGEVTTEGSEAFRPYIEAWFVNIKPQAVEITLAAAAESRARKRSQVDQGEVKAEEGVTEGERSGDDGDEFGEDAEHEDIDGLQYIKTGHFDQGPQKHMLRFPGSLAPPPSLFSAEPPRERKRSLQTTKQHMPKKMRRSSIAKPLPVQRSDSESNAAASQGGISYKALTISDHEAVTTFFETRFRQMQQLTCKVVAKAWIKVIEPKKQSNFPYHRGEESKPSWWPEGARHKEPDHLMKPGMYSNPKIERWQYLIES